MEIINNLPKHNTDDLKKRWVYKVGYFNRLTSNFGSNEDAVMNLAINTMDYNNNYQYKVFNEETEHKETMYLYFRANKIPKQQFIKPIKIISCIFPMFTYVFPNNVGVGRCERLVYKFYTNKELTSSVDSNSIYLVSNTNNMGSSIDEKKLPMVGGGEYKCEYDDAFICYGIGIEQEVLKPSPEYETITWPVCELHHRYDSTQVYTVNGANLYESKHTPFMIKEWYEEEKEES